MKGQSWIVRRKTRQIRVGNVLVGGDAPISVQSMTNTETTDVDATVAQIVQLANAGADIVRVSVPTMDAAEAFRLIKQRSPIPLVADIHFDYRIALKVAEVGEARIAPQITAHLHVIQGADSLRRVSLINAGTEANGWIPEARLRSSRSGRRWRCKPGAAHRASRREAGGRVAVGGMGVGIIVDVAGGTGEAMLGGAEVAQAESKMTRNG